MKILWIVPITGPDDFELKKRQNYLKNFLYSGTELIFRKVLKGTESIESRVDEIYSTLPVLEEALRAQREDFDACVIACAGDAGVAQAKELLTIPVIGPGESAILISQLLGRKVLFISSIKERISSLEEKVLQILAPNRFVISAINIPVSLLQKNNGFILKKLVPIINTSMAEDRIDTVILSCLSMGFMATEVQKVVGIPVIDPAAAAIITAQMMVKMKLSQSKITYPFPPSKTRSS